MKIGYKKCGVSVGNNLLGFIQQHKYFTKMVYSMTRIKCIVRQAQFAQIHRLPQLLVKRMNSYGIYSLTDGSSTVIIFNPVNSEYHLSVRLSFSRCSALEIQYEFQRICFLVSQFNLMNNSQLISSGYFYVLLTQESLTEFVHTEYICQTNFKNKHAFISTSVWDCLSLCTFSSVPVSCSVFLALGL